VLEPYECMPGCQRCARACTRDAIIMPARATLYQNTDAQAGVWAQCAGCALDCKTCRL